MNRAVKYFLFFMLAFFPLGALAAYELPPTADYDKCQADGGMGFVGNGDIALNEITIKCCPAKGFFTGRVINCVTMAIEDVTDRFLYHTSAMMQPIIWALMILVLTMFGVRMLYGAETEIQKSTFTLLLKFGIVIMMTNNLNGWGHSLFGAVEEGVEIVTENLDFKAGYSCDIGKIAASYAGFGGFEDGIVWQRLDCILDYMFGLGENTMLSNSFFAFMPALMMAGALSTPLVLIGLMAMIGIFTYVFKAVYAYLLAYLYLGFLIAISPMVIPLLLVDSWSDIVWTWTKMVLTAIAQPMMMFAYLTISMPLLDQVIFGGGGYIKETLSEVMRPEGAPANAPVDLSSYYRQNQQLCSRQSPLNPDMYHYYDKKTGDDIKVYKNDPGDPNNEAAVAEANDPNSRLGNFLAPMLTNSGDKCQFLTPTTVDFGTKHQEKIIDILFASVKLLIIIILIAQGMEVIPIVTNVIFGSSSLGGGIASTGEIAGKAQQGLGLDGAGAGRIGKTAAKTNTSLKNQLFKLVNH